MSSSSALSVTSTISSCGSTSWASSGPRQTGLNLSVALSEAGVLDKYNVELIGAKIGSIKKAEDRLLFKDAMRKIGLDLPESLLVSNVDKGVEFASRIGFPVILRPSFTLGGTGGGIAYNLEDLYEILERGLELSPVHEVLIEESVLGWKDPMSQRQPQECRH